MDDRLDDAVRYAGRLADVPRELLSGMDLKIEISNNAYFVAERIVNAPDASPPWDIVIADIHMPPPDSRDAPRIPQAAVRENKRVDKVGRSWLVYEWNGHTLSGGAEDWKHGGLHIAERLQKQVIPGKSFRPKLVLISRPLNGPNRVHVAQLVALHRSWLDYVDKDRWQEESTGNLGHLPDENVFVWALLDAIRKLHSEFWGRQGWSTVDVPSMYGSGRFREALIHGQRLVHGGVKTLLILGEDGTGRTSIVGVLHNEVKQRLAKSSVEIDVVDCPSLVGPMADFERQLSDHIGRAADGTLVFDDLDRAPRYVQARVYDLLSRRRFRRISFEPEEDCKAQLIICIMRDRNALTALNAQAQLDDRILPFFGDAVVELPPLRDRSEDFESLVAFALERAGHKAGISQEAVGALRTRNWPGNIRELFSSIQMRAVRAPWRKLALEDFASEARAHDARPSPDVALRAPRRVVCQYDRASDCIVAGSIRVSLDEKRASVLRALFERDGAAFRSRIRRAEAGAIYAQAQIDHAGRRAELLRRRAAEAAQTDKDGFLKSRAHQWREKFYKRLREHGIDPTFLVRFNERDDCYELVNSGWDPQHPVIYSARIRETTVADIEAVAGRAETQGGRRLTKPPEGM